MSEADGLIDWSKTTFDGSRREQLKRWRALTLRQRLEALEQLSEHASRSARMAVPRDRPEPAVHEQAADYSAGEARNDPVRQ